MIDGQSTTARLPRQTGNTNTDVLKNAEIVARVARHDNDAVVDARTDSEDSGSCEAVLAEFLRIVAERGRAIRRTGTSENGSEDLTSKQSQVNIECEAYMPPAV
jgi:hypothetical protein